MLPLPLLLLSLSLSLASVNAGLFPRDSPVNLISGQKAFKAALADNRTSVIAFVAPWCGHCQKLVPEYSKAASRLAPLVTLHAIDCDAEVNKRICAAEGVKGFPTVKMWKKGARSNGIEYRGERTQNAVFNWAKSAIPDAVEKLSNGAEGVSTWQYKKRDQPRAVLLNKSNKIPLMWAVLANQFSSSFPMANIRDRRGIISKAMGFPYQEEHRKPKIILWIPGKKEPMMYEGLLKYENLADFFQKFIKATSGGETEGKGGVWDLLIHAKEEKESVPEREMREAEAEALMQGKGYGNPHAGIPVGDDGLPIGAMHEGHGGEAYQKAMDDMIKASKAEPTQKVEEKSEANFDDLDLEEEEQSEKKRSGDEL